MILDEIIGYKKTELEERKKKISIRRLETEIEKRLPIRGFLKKSKKIQLIAELKKASPLKGIIREDFVPVKLAKICEENGADALSILTDEKYFKGSLDYINLVKEAAGIPILRKDFIIDEYQVIESRACGADAVLLLASILGYKDIQRFLDLSRDFGLKCLVEVHSDDDLKMVLDTSAEIVGINNRDLKTFTVDIKNTERLISKIPGEKVIVSESGISKRADVKYMEGLGIDAVLIGTAIMSAEDVGAKIRELLGNG